MSYAKFEFLSTSGVIFSQLLPLVQIYLYCLNCITFG